MIRKYFSKMINFDSKTKIFTLKNKNISYIFYVNEVGVLVKLYFGKNIHEFKKEDLRAINNLEFDVYSRLDLSSNKEEIYYEPYFSGLASPVEIPTFMSFDKRDSMIEINHSDNSSITDFRYHSHEIVKGKPHIEDLPQLRCGDDVETLIITLKDVKDEVYLKAYYTILEDLDVIIRHNEIINKGPNPIQINKALSLNLDINSMNYKVVSVHGVYASDRLLEENEIKHNKIVIDEVSGGKGFYHNPVLMLKHNDSTDSTGEVIGLGLIYTSNFKITVQGNQLDTTRVNIGMHDYNFEVNLTKGESFVTPEAFITYSYEGTDKTTQIYHDLVRNHLLRKRPQGMENVILLNSWEGCMFDFNTEKVIAMIDECKDLGVNLFVLDDGWFRNDDCGGLGDWVIDESKIDLGKVIDHAHKLGIKFGLWVEPEQISFNSNLYKNHPEYALYDKSLKHVTTFRHQLVLDLTNKEARDNVFNQICKIFDKYEIDYCKWDFNRMLTEAYSQTLPLFQQKNIFHLFVKGTYDLFNRFITRYPNILLESCSGGGGRFDFGMMYYSHQIWASDETDGIARSEIQYATNMFYPLVVNGSHVSMRKYLSVKEKAAVAMFGTFGYEFDPTKLTEKDKKEILISNEIFLRNKDIIHNGVYYPLINPFKTNFVSWEVVDKNKKRAFVFLMNYRHSNWRSRFLKLKGLDPNKLYKNSLDNKSYYGDFYMEIGLNLSVGMESFTPQLIEVYEE